MYRRWWIVLLTVVGCLAASACAGTVKTFDDEFSAAPLGSAWTALNRPGDASNSEAQCYRPANRARNSRVPNVKFAVFHCTMPDV